MNTLRKANTIKKSDQNLQTTKVVGIRFVLQIYRAGVFIENTLTHTHTLDRKHQANNK